MKGSLDSAVSISTRPWAHQPRNWDTILDMEREFPLLYISKQEPESTHPPIQCIPSPFFSGMKPPEYEADHSPQSSAGVKNAWKYPPLTTLHPNQKKHHKSMFLNLSQPQ
jgi:hypothetical protein